MEQAHPKSRFVKWSLIIGIVIVLNLFFNYSLSLVYPAPQFDAFCPNEQVINPPTTRQQCVSVGGQWTENAVVQDLNAPQKPTAALEVKGYCNPNYTCEKKYETARNSYERIVFIVLVILGIITLLIGIFATVSDVVTTALSLGGVVSLIIASGRYWTQAQNILKVVILAIALIALIWVGIKKFK